LFDVGAEEHVSEKIATPMAVEKRMATDFISYAKMDDAIGEDEIWGKDSAANKLQPREKLE
jgi:hypothetical protein